MREIISPGIESIHNMDRPRTVGVFVLLAEVLFGYWFSTPPIPISTALGADEGKVRFVSIAPDLTWPYPGRAVSSSPEASPSTNGNISDEAAVVDAPPAAGSVDGDETGLAEPSGPDDVRILSVAPSFAVPLWTGDVVNFVVTVEYNLASADSGSLALIIEECLCATADSGPIPIARSDNPEQELTRFKESSKPQVVRKGRKTVTLSKQVRIPAPSPEAHFHVIAHLAAEYAASGPKDGKGYTIVDPSRPATGSETTVRILSIQPAEGSVLRTGDDVDFEVAVAYNLISDLGTLTLKVENGGPRPVQEFSHLVRKGQGRRIFRERIRMQAAKSQADTTTVTASLSETEPRETATGWRLATTRTAADSRTYKLSGQALPVSPASARPQPDKSNDNDSMRIVSMMPSTDKLLRAGQTVEVEVKIEYNLVNAETAAVTLDFSAGGTVLKSEKQTVSKGRKILTFRKARLEVPPAKWLHVTASLSATRARRRYLGDPEVIEIKEVDDYLVIER
jgi:hypothetical protein